MKTIFYKIVNGDINNLSDRIRIFLSIAIITIIFSMCIIAPKLRLYIEKSNVKNEDQLVTTDIFMQSLANGLQARWDIEDYSGAHDISVTYTEAVRIEMKFISKYCGRPFEDKDLKDLFNHYYSALNMEYNAHDHTESYDDYITAYNIGYKPAKFYLICFDDYYDLRSYINDAYMDDYEYRFSKYRNEQ